MRLKEIMSRDVRTISPAKLAEEAWEKMTRHDIHHLVVVKSGEVQGLVSQRDLGGKKGASLRRGRLVKDVMSPVVITAKPTTTLRQAANLLRGYGIGCLPVMDNGKLKGVVTVSDLLELIGRGIERPVGRTPRGMLKKKLSRPEGRARPR